MVKAIFIDFYGTVVHEDGEVIKQISQEIFDTGKVNDKSKLVHIGGMNFRQHLFLLMEKIFERNGNWNISHWTKRYNILIRPLMQKR